MIKISVHSRIYRESLERVIRMFSHGLCCPNSVANCRPSEIGSIWETWRCELKQRVQGYDFGQVANRIVTHTVALSICVCCFLNATRISSTIDEIRFSAPVLYDVSRKVDEKSQASLQLISLTRHRSIGTIDSTLLCSPVPACPGFSKTVTFLCANEFFADSPPQSTRLNFFLVLPTPLSAPSGRALNVPLKVLKLVRNPHFLESSCKKRRLKPFSPPAWRNNLRFVLLRCVVESSPSMIP